ncbi:HNH endonuclease [Streptomyces sp. NPDC048603]|uniref:HNH endonuclease n=1 Tax=Streptomyces sp. NPDC048603 TaxID=3365577 RepID=UPI0037156933
MDEIAEKTCTKCKESRPLGMFSTDRRNQRDGKQSQCKRCQREWYTANRERKLEDRRRHHEANRDMENAYSRRWHAANRSRAAEHNRQWHATNPGGAAERARRRRARKASATVEPFTPADLRADWEDLDLYDCFFCHGPAAPLHVDHFYPLSPADEDGTPGPHAVWNLVPACETCNLSKSNRDPWQFLRESLEARGVDALTVLLADTEPFN